MPRTKDSPAATITPGVLLAGLALTWSTIAVIGGTTAHLASGAGSLGKWAALMVPMLLYYGCWLLASVAIIFLARRAHRSLQDVFTTVLLHLLLLFSISLATPFLVAGENWRAWLYGDRSLAFQGLTLAIYVFCSIVAYALKAYLDARVAEKEMEKAARRELELEKTLALTRHDALRMQMNPHFVFNTLNSVAALVHSNEPNTAYRAVELLGDVLRGILDFADSRLIALGSELDLVRSYVELERIRFGHRLKLVEEIEAGARTCSVPPLLIQPLVENVVKHVVAVTHDRVVVTITAHVREDGVLVLSVADDGPGMPVPNRQGESTGIGLSNIEDRLRLLFGPEASLTVTSSEGAGCRIEARLPSIVDDLASDFAPVPSSAAQTASASGRIDASTAPVAH